MGTVQAALGRLHPVVVAVHPHHHAVGVRHVQVLPMRKGRLLLGRAEIGPDDPAGFHHRIGIGLQLRRPLARGHVHDVEDLAIGAELPAMVQAADAAILDPPQHQGGAAMHAELVQHADLALLAAEHHEVLAQQPFMPRRTTGFRQLFGQRDRHPVAAEQRAHRRTGADPAQAVVFLSCHHGRHSLGAGSRATIVAAAPGAFMVRPREKPGRDAAIRISAGRPCQSRRAAHLPEAAARDPHGRFCCPPT